MPNKYNSGDTAFIVESNRIIREVKVLKVAGGFATLHFTDSDGGIKLRESRLFPTKEDAEASLPKKTTCYTTLNLPNWGERNMRLTGWSWRDNKLAN